ncbi:thiamine pyrophosphate-binding protein [Aeromicrobium sp. CTD01-1L150]|uniref:thiamine pyrophosphate-binding protein n=1 Tax=Aeromicrobium sp. CTD01-1L150 TaxID=3341830 RepID=UPI0035C0869E
MSDLSASRSGADLVVDCLVTEGVTSVFGLPGTTIMELIDSLARREGIGYLSTRHEQVAAFMADGFSRSGAGLGVAVVSRGPGAANAAIAVQNAHDESVPMLLLVGQVPGQIVERGAFEEMDVVASFGPFCKWAVEIRQVDRVPELLQRAVRTAVAGRPGPVVVSIPLDVLQTPTDIQPARRFRQHPPGPDPAAIHSAVDLLERATSPVIVLGGGASAADPAEVERLAERSGSPVVTTWMRKGQVPNDSPCFVGSLGYGAFTSTEAVVESADVILAIGCRFSEFSTKRWTIIPAEASLIHVDIDPTELGRIYIPEVGLVADASLALSALNAQLETRAPVAGAAARSARLLGLRDRFNEDARVSLGTVEPGSLETVASPALVVALQRLVDRDDVVLVQDVHSFGPWIHRYVRFDRIGAFYGSAGGAMAWGFPASIGIALGRPDSRVVSISGDGSFWMVAQDFETCVREAIPVVNLVVNNFAYGNTRDRQRFAHDGRYAGVFLGNPDFGEFARMLGGYGERVTDPLDLGAAIDRALAQDKPAIVDIVQDQMEGLPNGLEPLTTRES